MKVLIIPPDGPARLDVIDDDAKLAGLQALVEGYVQVVGFEHLAGDGWINEEGKMADPLFVNSLATHLCGSWLFRDDFIAGTLVVTGKPDSAGESTDVLQADIDVVHALVGVTVQS